MNERIMNPGDVGSFSPFKLNKHSQIDTVRKRRGWFKIHVGWWWVVGVGGGRVGL